MPWRDLVRPSEMSRVALVAPAERLRKVLVAVGEAGLVELDAVESPGAESDVVVSFDPPADTDADGPIGLGEADIGLQPFDAVHHPAPEWCGCAHQHIEDAIEHGERQQKEVLECHHEMTDRHQGGADDDGPALAEQAASPDRDT